MSAGHCPSCRSPLKDGAKFCSSCGHPIEHAVSAEHPANEPANHKAQLDAAANQLPRHAMSKKAKTLYTLFALSLFALFTFIFKNHLPGGAHPVIERQPEIAMATMYTDQILKPVPVHAEVENGKVSFSLSLLLEKKMIEFDYETPTGTLPLLAFISSNGRLVTAIRICEPCNSHNFRIEGTELACGNCETRWKLDNLEGIQGSCQKYPPDPIPSTIVGNRVQIDESVLKQWKMRI